MDEETQELTVQSNQLRAFCGTLYQKAGFSSEHAMVMTELQVEKGYGLALIMTILAGSLVAG